MATRDDLNTYKVAGDAAKVGIAAALVGLAANAFKQAGDNAKKQELRDQIAECDRKINELRSGLLGSWLNSDEIEALERQRAALQAELKKIG